MNRWTSIRLPLCLMMLAVLLAGCPPDFEDESCSSDTDCFVGDVCNTTSGQCVLEVVSVEPTITSLSASPNPAPPGSTVTVSWTTEQSLNGNLNDVNGSVQAVSGERLRSGSYDFVIGTQSETFTFVARNGQNSDERQVTVEIDPPALSIDSFEPSANPVAPNELLTLTWETTNAESGRIITGGPTYNIPVTDLQAGQWQTMIEQNRTFTLEITSVVGETTTEELLVVVEGGQPGITSFEPSEPAIVSGDSVELNWEILAAESITITDDEGNEVPTGTESPELGSVTVTPSETTEYTITASNQYGDSTSTTTVSVEELLSIDNFSPSQTPITTGDSVVLGWMVSGTNVTLELTDDNGTQIDVSSQPVDSGAVTVSPTTTTTYTLSASTPLQADSDIATIVVVPPPPTINSFSASPTEVVIGGSSTLSWDITGAASIEITNDLGATIPTAGKAATTDSIAVNLNATRTFTLRATNAGGFDEETVTVVAGSAVAVTAFNSSPAAISSGQSVTLSWTTSNADSIILESDQGDSVDLTGKAVAADSVTVSPTTTTVYTLTALGLGGPATRDVTVTVQPAVSVTNFSAAPTTVVAGSSTTLTWVTANASSFQITYLDSGGTTQTVNTVGKAIAGDSVTVTPTADTTYTITANGFQGPATATASVVVQQPVSITSFTTDRSVLAAGEAASLTWAVENATGVTITDSGGANVDLTGTTTAGDTVSVTPTATETYTLSATGPGGPVTQQITVEVVEVDGLTISEVHADPTGTDDARQWVELANVGSSIIDLSKLTIGSGASDYTESLTTLSGSLAPGGCVVVGGPDSDAMNGSPVYDVSADFDPDLAAVGGVALFAGPTAEQTPTRAPITSIVWGGSNPGGLLDSTGNPKADVSPALTEGSSLTRTSASDVLSNEAPTPGQCFHIESVSPSVGSNQASGLISIAGFGLDTDLDTFTIGTDALTSCADTANGAECTIGTSTQTGSTDLTVSRVNEFVSDGSGGTMLQPLPSPIDATLTDAYFFETEIADPGVDYYCGISNVAPAATVAAGTDVTVTLEVFLAGETDVSGVLPAGYVVEALEFAGGILPATIFGAGWVTTTSGAASGNNATFAATFNNASATVSEIAFRVSPDSGESWYYCDANASGGSDDGYQLDGGQIVEWQ